MMQQRSVLSIAAHLQRNFSRVATFSMATTAAAARAATPLLRQQLQQQTTKRPFSYTQKHFSSVAKQLEEALEKEIQAEKALEEDDLGGSAAPAIPGFKIAKDRAEFKLTKMHGNEKILVTVNVNHSVDIEEDDEEGEPKEMEQLPTPLSLPAFEVEITKADQRLVFQLQMMKVVDGTGYDYSVNEFMIGPAAKGDKYEELPEQVYSSSGRYVDPAIHELLFIRYLEERGIDTQFCHDFVKFATHYEHQQYVQMLEKIKNFVAK